MSDARALLVRAGALGDVLLLRPAVWALRRAGYEPLLMAPAASGRALLGPGGSETAALIDWERADVAALLDAERPLPPSLAGELRHVAVALACSRSLLLAARLREVVPRVARVDPTPPAGMHAAAWYAAALKDVGVDPAGPPAPPLVPSAEEEGQAGPLLHALPERFLAVHPGSGSPAKNWPAGRYAALVRALAGGRSWLLIEGPADAEAARALEGVEGAVRARGLDARVLGALLARAGLVVGNDSGVTHLAAGFGAPTLALFGPTDPLQWAPLGPRVEALRAPGGALDTLTLEAVLEAAARVR